MVSYILVILLPCCTGNVYPPWGCVQGLSAFQGRPLEGNTLNVNNTLVTLDHVLSDGDLIKLPDMDI